jgi:hypothetical protein
VLSIQLLCQQLKLSEQLMTKTYPCYLEVQPILKDITATALFKVKQFLETKIRAISQRSKKNINTQLYIQQQQLLKFKFFYKFFEMYSPKCAFSIRKEYASIMSQYYYCSFSNYTRALMKKYPSAFIRGNYNISTIVENNILDISSILNASTDSKKLVVDQYFCLRDRYQKCAANNMIPLATQNINYNFEELFTSIGMLLINTVSSEFVFCLEFFNSLDICNQLVSTIFSATLKHLFTFLENWVNNTLDGIAVLIILRKVKEFQQIMITHRQINEQSLSVFWGRVKKLCLERFQVIFNANADSLNTLLKSNLTSSIIQRESTNYTISKKYAHFSASICRLGFEKHMEQNIKRLAKLMESALSEMARRSKPNQIDHVLLINCIDHILKVFIKNNVKSELVRDWGELLVSNTANYIEQLLRQPYMPVHRIIAFLQACEARVIKGEDEKTQETNRTNLEKEIVIDNESQSALSFMDLLAAEFQQNWTSQLNQLYQQIVSEFPDKQIGQEIFQKCVLQFVLYYIRFNKIISYCYRQEIANAKIVSQTKIQHEITQIFDKYFKNSQEEIVDGRETEKNKGSTIAL